MEIVDAQVHVNRLVTDWQTTDTDNGLLAATTAMDAVGVDVVLIAESRGHDVHNHASSPKRRNAGYMRSGVTHPTLSGAGLPTRIARRLAWKMKTFTRFRLSRNSRPRGTSIASCPTP